MREVILPSGASWVKHGGKSGAPEAAVDSPLETWTKTCRSSTLGRLVAGVPLLLCAVLVLPRSAQADLQGSLLFGPAPPQPAYCTGGAGPTTVGIGSADGSTVYNPNVGTASGGIPSYTSGAYPTSNYYTSSWAGCSTTVTVDLLYPASWVVISFPGGVWAGTLDSPRQSRRYPDHHGNGRIVQHARHHRDNGEQHGGRRRELVLCHRSLP